MAEKRGDAQAAACGRAFYDQVVVGGVRINEVQDEEREALAALTREAFGQLVAMRKREGESLHADIVARLASIRSLQERLSAITDLNPESRIWISKD